MNLNRRSFLKSSSLLLGGILVQGNEIFSLSSEENNLKTIRNNIRIFNEKGGTIGCYVEGDTIIVIDSQFPDSAEHFKNGLNSLSTRKINYLINTHHHNDHTMGNYYLKEFSENILAHVNCPRLQIKQNKGKETEKQVVTANLTFENRLNISLPKEKLSAMYFGRAHTSGDIVLHFENSNVAHLGDLVFNNVYPYIDNSAECSIENWIIVLEKLEKYFDSDAKFIFGHANNNDAVTGGLKELIKKRTYLEALYDTVKEQVKNGKTIEQISDTNTIPGFDNIKESWEGARKMNLRATAEQLK